MHFVDHLLRLLRRQLLARRLLPRLYELLVVQRAAAVGVDVLEGLDQLGVGLVRKLGGKFEEGELGLHVRAQLRRQLGDKVEEDGPGQPRRDQPVKGVRSERRRPRVEGRHEGLV